MDGQASDDDMAGLAAGARGWLEAGFEALPLGAVVADSENRVRAANPAAAAVFGWKAPELLGKPVGDLLRWSPATSLAGGTPVDRQGRPRRHFLARALQRNGAEAPVCMTVTALDDTVAPWTLITVAAMGTASAGEPGAQGAGTGRALSGLERHGVESGAHRSSSRRSLSAGAGAGASGKRLPWAQRMTMAGEMLEVVLASRNVAEAEATLASYLPAVAPADAGCLWVPDTPSRLRPAVTWGTKPSVRVTLKEDECWALRRGVLHRTAVTWPAPLCPHFLDTADRPRWTLCAPLVAGGRLVGLLSLYSCAGDEEPEGLVEPPDPAMLELLVRQMAWALFAVHHQQQLRRRSDLDVLTEVLNRRYLDDQLDVDLVEAGARDQPVSVVMVDVDRFKMVNDSFGHARGDQVLRQLARLLEEATRAEDKVVRLGGDEFLVVLVGATLEAAYQRAEGIRTAAQSFCQLSAGVASYPAEAANATDLVRKADERLLAAKRAGRNQTVAQDL